MIAEYLTRGVKAGLVAGVVFGLFMALVANPLVVYADEVNHDAAGAEHGHSHEEADASMAVNKTVSVISSGLWAVLLGGVFFGIAFYFLEPAIPGTGATKSYVMALAGFITVSGAPWLVLPPVSPGVQQSMPVETRLLLYGGMMVLGALACLLAGSVYNRVSDSVGSVPAVIVAAPTFAILAIPVVLAPTNVVEGVLSPALRTGLIGLFVFGQILLWLTLAAAHAQFRSSDGTQSETATSTFDSTVTAN